MAHVEQSPCWVPARGLGIFVSHYSGPGGSFGYDPAPPYAPWKAPRTWVLSSKQNNSKLVSQSLADFGGCGFIVQGPYITRTTPPPQI